MILATQFRPRRSQPAPRSVCSCDGGLCYCLSIRRAGDVDGAVARSVLPFLSESDRFARGLVWASGPCLRFGVALLGLRLSVVISLFSVGQRSRQCVPQWYDPFFGGDLVARPRLRPGLGLLTGGAVGICGASAAMAISAALPESEEGRQTLFTVIGVTTFSTVAMVFYPIFGDLLRFTSTDIPPGRRFTTLPKWWGRVTACHPKVTLPPS